MNNLKRATHTLMEEWEKNVPSNLMDEWEKSLSIPEPSPVKESGA